MKPLSHPIGRRTFMGVAAATPLAVAAPAIAQSPIVRVGGPRLGLALNAYSFIKPLNEHLRDPSKGMDLLGVCDFAAKLDLEAVDLTGYFLPGYPNPPNRKLINQIKRHAHDVGLAICGTGIRNDFATADRSERAAGVERARIWVEVAANLGAPVLRLFAGPQAPFKDWHAAAPGSSRLDVEKWMADDLRACAEYGEAVGVIVAVQNHGDFLATAEDHLSLIRRVNHPWCGPIIDTGMYHTNDPYIDITRMVPHAVHWQIKETLGSTMESPRTDFQRLARIIRDGGYRGYLPIETLAMKRKDYDPAAEVIRAVSALREAIMALG